MDLSKIPDAEAPDSTLKELVGFIKALLSRKAPEPVVNVKVEPPSVNVAPPSVSVAAPNVTVEASVETAKKWRFTIVRDFRTGLIETVNAERIE